MSSAIWRPFCLGRNVCQAFYTDALSSLASYYNSYEDRVPRAFIYQYRISKWVTETWLHNRVPDINPSNGRRSTIERRLISVTNHVYIAETGHLSSLAGSPKGWNSFAHERYSLLQLIHLQIRDGQT